MKRQRDFTFWRHRDKIEVPDKLEIPHDSTIHDTTNETEKESECCSCCYCCYSPTPRRMVTQPLPCSPPPQISPESSSFKKRFRGPSFDRNKRFASIIESPVPQKSSFSVTSYAGQSVGGSEDGMPKTNQDSLIMLEDPQTQSIVLACLDGHGSCGHVISQFFKFGLEMKLFMHPLWEKSPKEAISQLLLELEVEICQYPDVDTRFSGTTLVMTVVRGTNVLTVNIGDSRSVLGSMKQESSLDRDVALSSKPLTVQPISLTIDHKPERPKELSRILQAGGRVFALPQDGPDGSQRVWLNQVDLPGLAMSRSLCDDVARTVGVISTPDFSERDLKHHEDCVLVLATDGIWDYLSNEEVIAMAMRKASPGKNLVNLIEEAKRRWSAAEGRVDDITACVVTLVGKQKFDLINS